MSLLGLDKEATEEELIEEECEHGGKTNDTEQDVQVENTRVRVM